MAWLKLLLFRPTLCVGVLLGLVMPACSLELVLAQSQPPSPSQTRSLNWGNYEPPPNIGKPGGREGGGTRGPCIKNAENAQPIALVPANDFGTTIAERPIFYVYVPPVHSEAGEQPQIEFTLEDENQREIYKTTVPLTAQAGILSFSLPTSANSPRLETGKNYKWSVYLVCSTDDHGGNKLVYGWIRRIQGMPTLVQDLEQAARPRDAASIYTRYGVWYDALSAIAELRRVRDDAILTKEWAALLESVGLQKIANEPLIQR